MKKNFSIKEDERSVHNNGIIYVTGVFIFQKNIKNNKEVKDIIETFKNFQPYKWPSSIINISLTEKRVILLIEYKLGQGAAEESRETAKKDAKMLFDQFDILLLDI